MLILKNKLYIDKYTPAQASKIKKLLTITNPIYLKKLDLSLALWDTDPTLKFYDELDDGSLAVPIGATNEVMGILGAANFRDERFLSSQRLKVKFTGKLYDYQQKALETLSEHSLGVLEAMTGSGKTLVGCALIAQIKQPTLILVHTKELKDQWYNQIKKFTTIKNIGVIGDSKYEVTNVTIALLQSLHTLSPEKYKELNSRFGMVITDETHIISAPTFYESINKLDAMYKFGMSATPKRMDGLTSVIFFATGPLVHKVPVEDLKDHVTNIEYEQIETDYFFLMVSSDEYTALMGDLVEDEWRNKFIIQESKKHIKDSCAYLSTRVSQLTELQKLLGDGVILTSKTPKKQREKIIEDFKADKIKNVFSTYQLFATGIDIPHLEYLFFCAPIRSEILVRQATGRLMRKYAGKQPKIYDFVDKGVPILRNQARVRSRIIMSLREDLS